MYSKDQQALVWREYKNISVSGIWEPGLWFVQLGLMYQSGQKFDYSFLIFSPSLKPHYKGGDNTKYYRIRTPPPEPPPPEPLPGRGVGSQNKS